MANWKAARIIAAMTLPPDTDHNKREYIKTMAGTSLLTLLDDIATLLDDVAVFAKVAAKKTGGVLGDDLALTAEQVTGIRAERELPVVFAVAKGSLLNKCILVPGALAINAVFPSLVTVLLMIGGAFLCYEGFEKVAEKLLHDDEERKTSHKQRLAAIANKAIDLVAFEKQKIKGAIRTDFILSAEIIVITLGVVRESAFMTQVLVLSGMAVLITAVVYGIVALIVRMDDAGLNLIQTKGDGAFVDAQQKVGQLLLSSAPYLMKVLSIVGTAAMFLVGGGILIHGFPAMEYVLLSSEHAASTLPYVGSAFSSLSHTLVSAVFGICTGALLVAAHHLIQNFTKKDN